MSTTASARAGSARRLPFTLKDAGTSTASANFAIDASTTLPGATATPNLGSLLPATDSSNPISVSVNVPAGTPVGTYDVILNARLGNGQIRTNTGKLVVKDTIKPTLTITLVTGQKTSTVLARGLKLKVKMSEAGGVTFVLTAKLGKNVTLARKVVSWTGAATKQVTLTLKTTAKYKAWLRALSKAKLTVHTSAKDLAGNTRGLTKTITLKR